MQIGVVCFLLSSQHTENTGKIQNGLVCSIDRGDVGATALLDFSSAFNILDHLILLDVFQKRFGVTGTAAAWF